MLPALDDLDPTLFDWPESLVLELIGEVYNVKEDGDRWAAARFHARFLRVLVSGRTKRMAILRVRLDLIAICKAHGVGFATVACADQAVFAELSRLVETRFRNSPRLAGRFLTHLQGAKAMLPKPAPAPRPPEPMAKRAPFRLMPRFAPAA